ncbi:MAG: type II secretion system F family protein [Armatimonadota bacterium]
MPVYSYTARDIDGALAVGSTAGANEGTVRRELRENGLFVITLEEQIEREQFGDRLARLRRVKLGDLVVFSQQLAAMVGAGIPVIECLHDLVEETESRVLRKALQQVVRDVQAGSTFSQALARHPHVFNDLIIALVHAGEVGGVLEHTLQRLADDLDKEQELREKVKSAFVYPAVVLVVAAGVVSFMLVYIIPVFKQVYGQFGSQLPAPTRMLIAFSNLTTHYWYMVLLGLVGVVLGIRALVRTKRGREVWDRLKLRLPLFGKLIRRIIITRFTRTLAVLVGAGVPLLHALQTAAGVGNNVVFHAVVDRIGKEVVEGSSLSAPVRASGAFPNVVPRLIQVGEDSGDLEGMLLKIAHFYEREVEYTVRRLTALMEPALTLVIGAIVGMIVVALYMPIFTLATVIRR